MISSLKGQNVLITGASSGFGWYSALNFAKYDSNLILFARRMERLEKLKEEIRILYPTISVRIYKVDVSNKQSIEEAFKQVNTDIKRIDILVNNAGLSQGSDPLRTISEESIDIMINTNVKGLVWVTQLVLPGMLQRNSGHIINVGSIAGLNTAPVLSVYGATKHAVHALS
ncbi:hypothetical protein BB560_006242, partial [Smittium megazygosporum]